MANRTVKDAHSIKGTNPQYLVEKITRTRIYESRYWKEECFALTAALLVDKAMELRYIGGVYGGNVKVTPFICLILKMLQIQPEKDIVIEFISNQDCKYVRALGALYMRLTGTSLDCYKYLEPLYLDYRKLRKMNTQGGYEVTHVDEFIDELLHEERSCDIILPRIQKRHVLEENNQLETRISALDDDLEDMDTDDDDDIENGAIEIPSPTRKSSHKDWDRPKRSPSPRYKRSRSRSPRKRRERRSRSKSRERKSHRSHHDRDRRRRSRSRERHRDRDSGRSRHRHDENDRRHQHRSSKKSKHDRKDKESKEDIEIAEANALRAKLGLAPLRP